MKESATANRRVRASATLTHVDSYRAGYLSPFSFVTCAAIAIRVTEQKWR